MKNFNLFEKLWEHSRTLRRVGMVLVMCLITITQMWAYDAHFYLIGSWNSWSATNTSYKLDYDDGYSAYSIYWYLNTDTYFALNNGSTRYNPTSTTNIYPGHGGTTGKYTSDGGGCGDCSWKYTGNPGIVKIHVDENSADKEWRPWVWVSRPTVYVRHNWNNDGWSNQAMTDNNDGTYTYIGQYSGSNQTNVGPCEGCSSGGDFFKYFSSATLTGSPAKGDRCLFTYNSSGFYGKGGQGSYTGSLTITKLYSITYNGNGKTSGSVPSSVTDKKWNETTTVADNTGSLVKTGYVFVGWNTASDGTGTYYAPGSSFTPSSASTTLYAQWVAVHQPGKYTTAADAGYGKTLTTYSGRDYEWYGVYKSGSTNKILADQTSPGSDPTGANVVGTFNNSTWAISDWIAAKVGANTSSSQSAANQFPACNHAIQLKLTTDVLFLAVTGYDQISLLAKDASGKLADNKYLNVYIDGTEDKTNISGSFGIRDYTLSVEDVHIIKITGGSASASNNLWAFSLRLPEADCTSPTIGTQPSNVSICSGSTTTLSVGSITGGTTPYTYQWYDASNDSPMSTGSGYATASFTTPTLASAASYYCIVTENGGCTTTSNTATVSMKTATSISTEPSSVSNGVVGSSCSLSGLVAAGSGTLTYQWQTCNSDGSSASDISSATNASAATATLSITPASAGTTYYKCVVTGDCGTATSNVVSILAKNAISPTLSYSPSVNVGSTLSPTLSGNTGSGTVTYTSSDKDVATVNSSGVVTGVAPGTVTITATIAATSSYWGNTANSNTITVTCNAVAAVSSLAKSTQTPSTLTYTWTKASNASGYTAKLWDNSTCTGDAVKTVNIASGSTETVTFTGLSASTTYYCKVQSVGDGTTYCADGGTTSAISGTTDDCTAISPSLSYPFSKIVPGLTLYSPTVTGNTGSGTVSYSSNNSKVTVNSSTGIVSCATDASAGTATITASISASGDYCSNSTTKVLTVVSDQSGIVKQTLTTGSSMAWSDAGIAIATTDGTNITSTTKIANTGLTLGDGDSNASKNGGMTGKITGLETGSSIDEEKYLSLGFKVKKGKKLNVSAIYIPVQPVSSSTNNFKAVLSDDDDDTDDIVGTLTNSPDGKLTYINFPSYGYVIGNVTLKIYAWHWSGGYRLGKSIVIDGTIEDACTPISATGSAGTASVTGKTTATLPYTLTNTTNVASVTIKVFDSNNDLVQTYEDQTATTSGSCSATGLTAGSTYKYTVTPIASSGYCDGDESSKSSAFTMQYGVSYYGDSPTSGSAPTDASGYASGATVTVAGNTGSMVKTGYTFRGWTYGGTFYLPGQTFTMPAENVTLTAVWQTNGGGGAAETIVLTDFGNQFYTSGPRYGRAYVGSTSGDVHVIESNSSNNKGISDSTAIRIDYGTYIKVLGPNATVADYTTDSTFSGVSKIEFRWKLYNGGSPAPTTTVDVYVGNTKVASGIELTGGKKDPFVAISPITVSPAKNGAVKIVNTGTSTTHHLHIDSIAISYAGGATTNYNVSFANKTGFGGSASLPSTITGVPTGNKIVQPADPTATGYTFDGWYPTAACNTSAFSFNGTITKDTTIYAKWEANKYTITLDNQGAYSDGTHADGPADKFEVTYGTSYFTYFMVYPPSITGYDNFCGWYSEVGGGGDQIITYLGGLVDGATVYTDASGKWNYDGDVTVYAKWTMTLTGANINKAGGLSGAITLTYNSSVTTGYTPTTKTGYILDGYYTAASDGDKLINADGTLVAGSVTGYITDGKWTYTGSTPTIYAHWTPIEYTITFAHNGDASYLGSESGTAPDNMEVDYTTSVTMPKAGDAKIFTRDGYELNGWAVADHKAKGAASATLLSDYDYAAGSSYSKLTSEDGATVTLYPKWLGNIYTISLNARGGSVYPTSINVRYGETYGTGYYGELPEPSAPTGKEFIGWYTSPTGGTRVTKDTQLTTIGAHTLYARYTDIAMVYFKNTIGWENVYVTYDAYWDNTNGTGNNGKIYHKMTKVAGTEDVYCDPIPGDFLSAGDWAYNIAFNNTSLSGHNPEDFTINGACGNYSSGEVVFREDFDSIATMFVPKNVNTNNTDGNYQKNSAQYISTGYDGTSSGPKYTSGYWMKYGDTYSGYTLTYQKNGGSWTSGLQMHSEKAGDSVFVYTLKLDANSQYNFAFYKDYKQNSKSRQFNYRTQITSAACTDLKLVCDPNNAWMQTTAAGEYTFKLALADDGHMYLSVEYPLAVNDYQVLYSWNDGSAHTYASEVIKAHPGTIDSISVFVHKLESPVVSRSMKIQKCTAITAGVPTWTDVEGGSITLSGEDITKSGVYDFAITQPASGDPTGSFGRKYEGDYYIRTTCSDGGWDYYKEREDNVMTYSAYSMTQTLSDPYSHYYCRYVGSTSTDITFAIATKYSPNISGIMTGDATIGNAATKLPANANVRFSWNEETNAMQRAYIKDAQGPSNSRFMVMHGADGKIFNPNGSAISASGSLAANELQFDDMGDWIYQVMLQAQPGAQVSIIANYNDADRYLVGGAESYETIMGGSGSTKYDIRAIYDFKTNRLMNAWTPSGDIEDALSDIDMLWIRYKQDAAQQITFNGGSLKDVKVVGAIRLDYDDLVGHVASWTYETRPLLRYYISFPFDVNVSDVFGLHGAELGREFVIRKYDGAERAKNGLYSGDGDTYWVDLTMDSVMHAHEGYSLVFDNEYLNGDLGTIWTNKSGGSSVFLYFPAAAKIDEISEDNEEITIKSHLCESTRTFSYNGSSISHANSDSHWNLIGSPLFVNSYVNSSKGTNGQTGTANRETLDSYYAYDAEYNRWIPTLYYNESNGEYYVCKVMHAMLVQFSGTVEWSKTAPDAPELVAARERQEARVTNRLITLNLLQDGVEGDHTYIKMAENGNPDFMLCEDLFKVENKKVPNIFSYASGNCVAYNKVAIENQIIPLGLNIRANGTYTFEMPENVAATVTLIDNFDGSRTILNIEDYTVQLNRGNYYDRFSIEINVHNAPTAIDGVTDGSGSLKDGKAHKFIMNDQIYILKDGQLYDARGQRVQ